MVEDRVTEVTDRMASKDLRRPASAVVAPPSPPVGPPEGTDTEGRVSWRFVAGFAVGIAVLVGALYVLLHALRAPDAPVVTAPVVATPATAAPAQTSAPVAVPTVQPTTAPTSTLGVVAGATTQPATKSGPAPTSAPLTAPMAAPTSAGAIATALPAGPTTAPAAPPVAVATEQGTPEAFTTSSSVTPGDGAPSSQPPSSGGTSIDADLAAQVLNAYSRYWSVRVLAMADPARTDLDLESVMADKELTGARKTLSDLQEQGKAARSSVEHHLWVTYASPDQAQVLDEFTTTSEKLDPATKEPVDAAAIIEHQRTTFLLQNNDGRWKVVDERAED